MPDDVLELVLSFRDIPPGEDDPWPVGCTVSCPQLGLSYDRGQFTNPLGEPVLADIRWYLEEYPKWPTDVDRPRVHQIEANLDEWGRALFDAAFERRVSM